MDNKNCEENAPPGVLLISYSAIVLRERERERGERETRQLVQMDVAGS
jgi:hypothetical protein